MLGEDDEHDLPSRPPAPAQDAVLAPFPPTRLPELETVEELSAVVAATAAEGLVLAPLGGGTSLGIGRPLKRYDAAIRMRRLNRIVDYAPEDQVIVVEAGVTLDELQQVVWTHRQRLAIDPPGGELMTVGGIVATNAYGPSVASLTWDDERLLIVGIEAVRADGARSPAAAARSLKMSPASICRSSWSDSLGALAIIM